MATTCADSDNSEEYLFLDSELLSELSTPQNLDELKNTVKEIREAVLEQLTKTENVKAECSALKENIKVTTEANAEMNRKFATLKDELHANEEAFEKIKSQGRSNPHKFAYQLYYSLTKIKWDMDCPENEVAGVIAGVKGTETFKFDSDKNSEAFICNHLWDMIGNAVEL